MNYKVVPFVPKLDLKNPSGAAAATQLNEVINQHATEGWTYVRLESVSALVTGESGCFGLNAKPSFPVQRQMIVFKKDL